MRRKYCTCDPQDVCDEEEKKQCAKRRNLLIAGVAGACVGAAAVCVGIYLFHKKSTAFDDESGRKTVDPVVKLAGAVAIPLAVKDGAKALENSRNLVEEAFADKNAARKVERIKSRVKNSSPAKAAKKLSNPFEGRHYICLDDIPEQKC